MNVHEKQTFFWQTGRPPIYLDTSKKKDDFPTRKYGGGLNEATAVLTTFDLGI